MRLHIKQRYSLRSSASVINVQANMAMGPPNKHGNTFTNHKVLLIQSVKVPRSRSKAIAFSYAEKGKEKHLVCILEAILSGSSKHGVSGRVKIGEVFFNLLLCIDKE